MMSGSSPRRWATAAPIPWSREDQQDIYGVPAWPDHTDMVDERGIIHRLAGDVLTLLKATGVEVEGARDE